MATHSAEERTAATAVASLGSNSKHSIDLPSGGYKDAKKRRMEQPANKQEPSGPNKAGSEKPRAMRPHPFFFYRDFSEEADPDPLTPLTPPGRVPNFPAKMHSILSRPELADVVAWMPHGRAWRVLRPREFEIRVIPTYFEHAKFSSFIRQANGWGFRRITTGKDRNAYYHELFLRGLPHLCKKMKRPGVAEKQTADPEHEPDLKAISELHPVPEKADDDSILLQCTLQGGPKARMPLFSSPLYCGAPVGAFAPDRGASSEELQVKPPASAPTASLMSAGDRLALSSLQLAVAASENQFRDLMASRNALGAGNSLMTLSSGSRAAGLEYASAVRPAQNHGLADPNLSAMVVANQLALQRPMASTAASMQISSPAPVSSVAAAMQIASPAPAPVATAFQSSSAASHFAAGFAAATAISQQQFRSMLGNALGSSRSPGHASRHPSNLPGASHGLDAPPNFFR